MFLLSRFESLEKRLALSSDPIVILPLGDSITQGEFHPTAVARQSFGYRAALQQMLVEHEIEYDFVGTEDGRCREPEEEKNSLPFEGFDPDHEGHWGWTADEMLDGRSWELTCGEPERETLPQWFEQHESVADIVLLHLGTNEIIQALPADHTAARNDLSPAQIDEIATSIEVVVETIELESGNPDLKILVAEIIPGTLFVPETEALNEQLSTKLQAMPNVVMVDQFTGFDPTTMTHDAVHPNAVGQQHMAERWFDAIHAVAVEIENDSVPDPIESGARPGDANLDGVVDFNDFLVIAANYNQEGSWSRGDFNGDGFVDFADFLALSRNFGNTIHSTD